MIKSFLFFLWAGLFSTQIDASLCFHGLQYINQLFGVQNGRLEFGERYVVHYKRGRRSFVAALKFSGMDGSHFLFRTPAEVGDEVVSIHKDEVIRGAFLSAASQNATDLSQLALKTYQMRVNEARQRNVSEKIFYSFQDDTVVVDKAIRDKVEISQKRLEEFLKGMAAFKDSMRERGLELRDPVQIMFSDATATHSANLQRRLDSSSPTRYRRDISLNIERSLDELSLGVLLHEQGHLHIEENFSFESPVSESTTINEAIVDLLALDYLEQGDFVNSWAGSGKPLRSLENRATYLGPLFGGEEGALKLHDGAGNFASYEGALLLSSLMWKMRGMSPRDFRKSLSDYIFMMDFPENKNLLKRYKIEWSKEALNQTNNLEYLNLHYALASMKKNFRASAISERAQSKIDGVIKEFHLNKELIDAMEKRLVFNDDL